MSKVVTVKVKRKYESFLACVRCGKDVPLPAKDSSSRCAGCGLGYTVKRRRTQDASVSETLEPMQPPPPPPSARVQAAQTVHKVCDAVKKLLGQKSTDASKLTKQVEDAVQRQNPCQALALVQLLVQKIFAQQERRAWIACQRARCKVLHFLYLLRKWKENTLELSSGTDSDTESEPKRKGRRHGPAA